MSGSLIYDRGTGTHEDTLTLKQVQAKVVEAADELEQSIRTLENGFEFTLPEYDGTWKVNIAGRMRMEWASHPADTEDMVMSVHYLEGETWESGRTYSVETADASLYDELTMWFTVTSPTYGPNVVLERPVDLLEIIDDSWKDLVDVNCRPYDLDMMTVSDVTPDGLTLTITHGSCETEDVLTGEMFRLERLENGGSVWREIETRGTWDMITYVIPVGGSCTQMIDYGKDLHYNKLEPGHYRISKEMCCEERTWTCYAKFDVTE